MTNKVLFLLKRREDYSIEKHSSIGLSTGLYNSAKFMDIMLNESEIESHLEVCIDNNNIDAYVTKYRPTHVIIEALWCVPQKFQILTKLHPNVTWIIRIHSEMPFMAGEGNAMDWIGDYASYPNINIACNSPRMLGEIKSFLSVKYNWSNEYTNERVMFLPNYYPQEFIKKQFNKNKETIDISCFGAVRPLKNHLLQAHAAIKFANKMGKKLRFHINSGRIEMKGDSALSNLKGLFQHMDESGHELISHEWTPREQFLELCGKMDIAMQVSFTETWNIVSGDSISQGVPIVVSSEIPWASYLFLANPVNSDDMVNALHASYNCPQLNVWLNKRKMTKYTNNTRKIWEKYFGTAS